jgi:PAS domain S-box-containing protein
VQTTADVVVSIDKSERISFINAAAETLFGYKPQDIVGKPLTMLLPPTYRSGHSRHIESFRSSSDSARMMAQRRTVYGLKKDGQMVPLQISILKHKKQGPFTLTAVIRDASEGIAQQTRVLEGERRYRALLESRGRATLVLTAAGRIIDLNEIVLAEVKAPRDDIVGKHIWDAPWWRGDERRSMLRDMIENPGKGGVSSLVMEADFGDGKAGKVSLTLTPIRQEAGTINFIIVEWQERDAAKASGKTSRHKTQLDLLQRVSRVGIWELELPSRETHWSDEIYRIWGLPDETRPVFGELVKYTHPEDMTAARQAIEEALKTGRGFTNFHRIITPAGSEKMVQNTTEIMCGGDGAPFLIVGAAQDITEQWLREKELSAALEQAETASLAKSRFLANLGHELRTPLNAVIGFGEFIASHEGPMAPEKTSEYAGYVVEGGRKLLGLVNDIILASQLDAAMVALRDEQTEMKRILQQVLQLQTTVAEKKGITIDTVVPGDLMIMGDEKLLVQAISKIVGNAIKFGREGGRVSIWVVQDESGIHVIVEDDGDGMSEEMVSEALQPFFQTDELNRRTDGIGLGLAITRDIMKLHDGKVRVENLPSQGASVRLSLPLHRLVSGGHGKA